ncbi:hypothetical protein DBR11_04470 [Pedobacter sp. HMWF019]|nr:hypothetical protein DBR11_04470 [Pedobacter sp. HMWF019]
MKEAISNPSEGTPLSLKLGDSRWPGWKKMQYVHRTLENKNIAIHYVADFKDGKIVAVDDFKFHEPK